MPGFHSFYWLGLAARTWPHFAWADGSPGGSGSGSSFRHWGYYMPQNILEPNNLAPPELCAGANASQAYERAWGWADTGCAMAAPYMCRRLGGCTGQPEGGGPAGWPGHHAPDLRASAPAPL
jgi:hypothetical protein